MSEMDYWCWSEHFIFFPVRDFVTDKYIFGTCYRKLYFDVWDGHCEVFTKNIKFGCHGNEALQKFERPVSS